MKEQKCSHCKQWNVDAARCVQCGAPLIAEEINKDYKKKLDEEFDSKPDTKFDILTKRMKNSPYVLVRGSYYFLFSVWSIYMFFVSVFVFLAAATPG
jgi:uncharacterized membrane protein YvbJ